MARDFNQNRIANAVLKAKKGINSPSVFYAVNDNADGYNMIEVSSLPSVELFIGQGTQAQEDITEWTLFNNQENYGGIGENAFGRFPSLKEITIWQEPTDSVLTIDDDAFSTNVEFDTIYVHPDLLGDSVNPAPNTYRYVYADKSFVSFFTSYDLVTDYSIPTQFNGETAPTTLTKEWVDKVVANMPLIERNAKTTIIVPGYFIGIDSGAFSGLGSLFTYITELKCNGTKTFNAGFLNGASWCIHLWLDNGSNTFNGAYVTDSTIINANFRTLAPYLVFTNYFMSEYATVYPVIGYNQFASGDSLPINSPTGTYLWFSDINFNTDYESPTGLENDPSFIDDYEASSSGYYYCYDKTTILVIQGSGTLTSAIVENAINGLDTPLSWINKVVIPNTFTDFNNKCLDVITLTGLTLETKGFSQDETHILHSDFLNSSTRANHFNKVIFNDCVPTKINSTVIYFPAVEFYGATQWTNNARQMEFTSFYAPNLETFNTNYFLYSNFGDINMPNLKSFTGTRDIYGGKIINLDNLETTNGSSWIIYSNNVKLPKITQTKGFKSSALSYLYIGTSNCQLDSALFQSGYGGGLKAIYIPRGSLSYYQNATNWSDYASKFVEYDY